MMELPPPPDYPFYFLWTCVSLVLVYIAYRMYKYGKVQGIQLDAAWKKHVKRLEIQGIDPSYIKRTSEWEESQRRKEKEIKMMGIVIATDLPVSMMGILFAMLIERYRAGFLF